MAVQLTSPPAALATETRATMMMAVLLLMACGGPAAHCWEDLAPGTAWNHSASSDAPSNFVAAARKLLQSAGSSWAPSSTDTAQATTGQDSPSLSSSYGGTQEAFATINNGEFVVGCTRFFPMGWNWWETVEAAAGAPFLRGASIPKGTTGPQLVRQMMDAAVAHGMTVLRVWATTIDPEFKMQSSPGVYKENIMRGLDYVLDEARKRGLKLILSLLDNWHTTGGVDEIVQWSGTAQSHEDFFNDPTCKQLYKNHVAYLLTRTNTINGRAYRQDPTIFAWNLINEPRCYQCPDWVQAWIDEMAPFVKSLDPFHLLTVGEEGFYSSARSPDKVAVNPSGAASTSWADTEGQDFVANHRSASIDYAAMHSWPDNWRDADPARVQLWIDTHARDSANTLGKPLLLQEFGKWLKPSEGADVAQRKQFYRLYMDAVQRSVAGGGSLKGSLFWTFLVDGQQANGEEGGSGGKYGIFQGDETFSIVSGAASSLKSQQSPVVCAFGDRPGVPPVPDCSSTRVQGKEGTGKEGVNCDIDINECVRGTAGCDAHATCVNLPGSYTCVCQWGYQGDGFTCSPTSQLSTLPTRYTTQGPGQLACSEGQDVPYPTSAPGYIDDPTGYFSTGVGSRTPVEWQECAAACEMSGACDSFAYNPFQQMCFLKRGASRAVCGAPVQTCRNSQEEDYECGRWQTYFRNV